LHPYAALDAVSKLLIDLSLAPSQEKIHYGIGFTIGGSTAATI
jgi:hypothetical protein